MNLTTLYEFCGPALKRVDTCLTRQLTASKYPELNAFADYVLEVKGKRLRPVLCILSYCSALGLSSADALPDSVTEAAAAIEILHMASLIHDDIVDDAALRHGRPAFHTKWNPHLALLMGIYLYTLSLELVSDFQKSALTHVFTQGVKQMCEGEMKQVSARDANLSVPDYFQILADKTGALFSLACRAGFEFTTNTDGSRTSLSDAYAVFGRDLGILFQLTDDLLDLDMSSEVLKKKTRQDFLQGDMTLPLILLQQQADTSDRVCFKQIMADKDSAGFAALNSLLDKYAIKAQTQRFSEDYKLKCLTHASHFPNNPATELMLGLVQDVLQRA